MAHTIPVAHDFTCPWCWVGFLQAQRLRQEFGVAIEWRGYELNPEGLENVSKPSEPSPPNKPRLLGRLDFLHLADQIPKPRSDRPSLGYTHSAHEAVEYAKVEGVADVLVDRLYRAYWEDAKDITDTAVILDLAKDVVADLDGLRAAMAERRFAANIVSFDAEAYRTGVYNVPTFFIGEERLAEQPYSALREAMHRLLGSDVAPVYGEIHFPPAPDDRPWVFLDMIATVDGKILSGEIDEGVQDLGSTHDKQLLKFLEASADAVLMGAQTLRATPSTWSPQTKRRLVVTRSGNVPRDHAYLRQGESEVLQSPDLHQLLRRLRSEGVQRLLLLGGSDLNAQFLRHDWVDEIFLTIAPKLKLGRAVPTIAGGDRLSRSDLKRLTLLDHRTMGDEVFLRYRRKLE